jgi:hypothetical protein
MPCADRSSTPTAARPAANSSSIPRHPTGNMTAPAASLGDGRFVVTWSDLSQSGADTSGSAMRGQIFNADGGKAWRRVPRQYSATDGWQYESAVTALGDGRFVVTWSGHQPERRRQLGRGRARPDLQCRRRPGRRRIPRQLDDIRQNGLAPSRRLAAMGFVVTWTDYSQSGGDLSGGRTRPDLQRRWSQARRRVPRQQHDGWSSICRERHHGAWRRSLRCHLDGREPKRRRHIELWLCAARSSMRMAARAAASSSSTARPTVGKRQAP